MEVVKDVEARTTWSVSAFSILLLSQVTMLSLFLLVCTETWCNITHMYIAPSLRGGGGGGRSGGVGEGVHLFLQLLNKLMTSTHCEHD